jgi:mono/diheme cytochrome c family protein
VIRKVAILVIVLLVLLGGGWLWITRMAGGFSARAKPSVLEIFAARAARRLATPTAARNQKNPFSATGEVLADAKAHFADHCAICHANNGSGETTIGQNLYPKAPDLRLPTTQRLSDGQLYYIIHNGVRLTGMPAWGTDEKDDDSWKLVVFIRHLPRLTSEEEEEMKKLNPKSPDELKEEQEEEQFLNQPSSQSNKPTHHNH